MGDGGWIRSGRKTKGWSQAVLGAKVGASQVQISLWERSKSTPTPEVTRRLVELLGVTKEVAPAVARALAAAGLSESPKSAGYRTTDETQNRARPKKKAKAARRADDKTGSLGFEAKLWDAADLLRSNMDPAEYKHVVLGLLFLKYVSDAFEDRGALLAAACVEPENDYYGEDPADLLEDRDEYTAENVFWVPEAARWSHLKANARQPGIGRLVDDAMDAVERENPTLKGVLPKVYALPNLANQSLGKLIDLVSGIDLGSAEHRAKDTLGRVYEYFLARFASSEGKGGGEFYTPTSVVHVLVEMLEPYRGRVYDPCCGSGACSSSRSSSSPPSTASATRSRCSARSRTSPPGAWRA